MTGGGAAAGVTTGALVLAAAASLRAGLDGRRRAATAARLGARSGGPIGPSGEGSQAPPGPGRAGGTAWRLLLGPPAWLGPRLTAMGVAMAPEAAFTAWAGTAAVTVTAALLGAGPGAAALAAAVVAGGPWLVWRVLRHRGDALLDAALPAAVEAVAAGLRSGASLRQAVAGAAGATTGTLGDDLAAVATAIERGAGVVAALEGWAARRPLPGVRLVVAALCLGAEAGGAAAQAVDAVAATLRQRLAAQAEARALATQARVSAVVIAAAPVAFCVLSTATDRRSAAFLLRTPPGLALLAAGLALDGAGALWMARLTRLDA